jgi:hypothetical protein
MEEALGEKIAVIVDAIDSFVASRPGTGQAVLHPLRLSSSFQNLTGTRSP